jgi:hypothetical protein
MAVSYGHCRPHRVRPTLVERVDATIGGMKSDWCIVAEYGGYVSQVDVSSGEVFLALIDDLTTGICLSTWG